MYIYIITQLPRAIMQSCRPPTWPCFIDYYAKLPFIGQPPAPFRQSGVGFVSYGVDSLPKFIMGT